MQTIKFFKAVESVFKAGYIMDIVPSETKGAVILMIVPQPDETGNYDRVFQDSFTATDLKSQAEFIEYAFNSLKADGY